MTAIPQQSNLCNDGPDIDICTCAGSVALLPMSRSAKSYCQQCLPGWAIGGMFFIPRDKADIIMRILTQRFSCRVDHEIVS
jgi:hypothetical protein